MDKKYGLFICFLLIGVFSLSAESTKQNQFKNTERQKLYFAEMRDARDAAPWMTVYSKADFSSPPAAKLRAGQKVEILRSLEGGWFKIAYWQGEPGYSPRKEAFADSRTIWAKDIPLDKNKDSEEWVVIFNHDKQELSVYHQGKLLRQSTASSGLPDTFTPRGLYRLSPRWRGKWHYSRRFKVGMKYWISFLDDWWLHSVPHNASKEIIKEEAAKLGQAASHGCVRLPVEAARYVFETVPAGSLLIIN